MSIRYVRMHCEGEWEDVRGSGREVLRVGEGGRGVLGGGGEGCNELWGREATSWRFPSVVRDIIASRRARRLRLRP